jgi:hypothetical protein
LDFISIRSFFWNCPHVDFKRPTGAQYGHAGTMGSPQLVILPERLSRLNNCWRSLARSAYVEVTMINRIVVAIAARLFGGAKFCEGQGRFLQCLPVLCRPSE